MNQVLIIAYFFPPLGGAGVQRTLKFVRYLPEYGWQPHVLTVHDEASLQDPSLSAEIPTGMPVTRTPAFRLPVRLPWRVRNFINRWLLIVDEQVGWKPYAISAGNKILHGTDDFKLIYSSAAPYTAHLVANRLHQRTHLPWVADFRDPWLENPYIKFPTTFHRRLNEQLERNVFTQAERVILNTDTTRQRYLQKYPYLPASKSVVIPNGYDQDDILERGERIEPDSTFTIVHLGSLYPKSRSSKYFLNALQMAMQTGGLLPDKIKVQFIGDIDKETRRLVKELNLGANVDLIGYLPHRQALGRLVTADLLLLIPSYGIGSDLFIPAKLFEYLASRRPILCLAEPGDCADLIIKTQAGSVVPPTDTKKIADELVRLYCQWGQAGINISPRMDLVASFERHELTRKLAGLFSEIAP